MPEGGFGGTGRRARRTGAYVKTAGGPAEPVWPSHWRARRSDAFGADAPAAGYPARMVRACL